MTCSIGNINIMSSVNIGNCTLQSLSVLTCLLDCSQLTCSLFWIHFSFSILLIYRKFSQKKAVWGGVLKFFFSEVSLNQLQGSETFSTWLIFFHCNNLYAQNETVGLASATFYQLNNFTVQIKKSHGRMLLNIQLMTKRNSGLGSVFCSNSL